MIRSLALVLAMLATPLLAQRYGGAGDDWYTIGGIQARGDVIVVDGRPAVEVKAVHEGGRAEKGGLLVGDRIVAAGGKRLEGEHDEVVLALCLAIEKAEEKKPRGPEVTVDLEVIDAQGAKAVRAVPVRYYGPWTDARPTHCKRTQAILHEALDFLKAQQASDGHFPQPAASGNQRNVTAALGALAFLGSGQKRYGKCAAEAIQYVTAHVLDEDRGPGSDGANWNQSNWSLSYGAILLSEVFAQDRKKSTKEVLEKVVAKLLENQEISGGWAHGPGGPNALGYLELEIMSNYAIAGLGMARSAGVDVDAAKRVKAVEWVKACTSGGGVAYSPRPGQAGHGDPGRTAGAYWALRLLGEDGRLSDSMYGFFERQRENVRAGHVSPMMHLLAGGLASAAKSEKELAEYWKVHRSFVLAARDRDGAFDAWPTEESRQLKSNADRGNGPAFITAHLALLMELGGGRFELLDRPAQKP